MAAKYQKEIAEMYEASGDLEKSIQAFEAAAEFFEGEGSTSSGNSCLLKVAHSAALIENYTKAAEIFEKVAAESVNVDLLKFSVKEYLLKSGICQLCTGDVVACKRALDKYINLSAEFATTREYEFLSNLVTAIENYDSSAFATASQEYNSIVKLDPWKTKLLVKIKESISDDNGEGSEEIG